MSKRKNSTKRLTSLKSHPIKPVPNMNNTFEGFFSDKEQNPFKVTIQRRTSENRPAEWYGKVDERLGKQIIIVKKTIDEYTEELISAEDTVKSAEENVKRVKHNLAEEEKLLTCITDEHSRTKQILKDKLAEKKDNV